MHKRHKTRMYISLHEMTAERKEGACQLTDKIAFKLRFKMPQSAAQLHLNHTQVKAGQNRLSYFSPI